jgi:hypothetical protein
MAGNPPARLSRAPVKVDEIDRLKKGFLRKLRAGIQVFPSGNSNFRMETNSLMGMVFTSVFGYFVSLERYFARRFPRPIMVVVGKLPSKFVFCFYHNLESVLS